MNQKNGLNCIVTLMCLCVSFVFFTTSSAEVFAQESKGRLTVGVNPWGVGLDLGQVVFMVGGDFDFDRHGSDEKTTTVEISPQASLKLFLQRAELSPYLHAWVSKTLVFEEEESDGRGSTWFVGALGLEYSVANNLSLGGEVGLRFYDYRGTGDWSSTSVGSYHSYTLRFIF